MCQHSKCLTISPKVQISPEPLTVLFFGNLQWLSNSIDLKPHLWKLHGKHDPILTFRIGSGTLIFIFDHVLAHKTLVQKGSVFSNCPHTSKVSRIFTNKQNNINRPGGLLWRILRRNLMSEKFDETIIKEILGIHRHLLRTSVGFNVFPILPNIGSLILRKCWKEEVLQIRHEKLKLLDQLDLEHPHEEGRKLQEEEMVSLCKEFLNGGVTPRPHLFSGSWLTWRSIKTCKISWWKRWRGSWRRKKDVIEEHLDRLSVSIDGGHGGSGRASIFFERGQAKVN
ncbi:cytochrome P450 89A2 [Cinnamomum micranthum f. kanehirae]|uniref:Cytochrome P450 89A2 n=1 Tax=Cinnamomum micranthum f. kanehirae TaxID=337451 RepID=A0A3S3P125_9MAGN|nr:cytochrome P450 89A2 [Cinnamomum micranthum f. kanehirae]